jgi:hypothetical protein
MALKLVKPFIVPAEHTAWFPRWSITPGYCSACGKVGSYLMVFEWLFAGAIILTGPNKDCCPPPEHSRN